MTAPAQPAEARQAQVGSWRPAFIRSVPLRLSVFFICLLWTIPTLGLLVTSVRNPLYITTSGWWEALLHPFEPNQWTISNYQTVIASDGMGDAFINSLIVTVPSVAIPITIAAFAAYAFAWIPFRGRGILFTIVVALLVVPIQMSLIPILQIYAAGNLYGSFLGIWLAHTGFGLPLAIFLLYNFMSQLPRDLFESAAIDGASHLQTFMRIVLPLSIPALGAIAIFQFLWVWNDLLVALVFLGPGQDVRVLPTALYQLIGSRGGSWHLLTAGAFITMVVPLVVFLAAPAGIRTRDHGRLRQVVTLARLMIAFVGHGAAAIGGAVDQRRRRRGRDDLPAPQRRRCAAAPQADRRHPGGPACRCTAAADRGRPGVRATGRAGRRHDPVRGRDGARRDRRRGAGRARRRRDGTRAARPRRQRGLRTGLRRGQRPGQPGARDPQLRRRSRGRRTARGGHRPRPAGRGRRRDGQALPGRRRHGRGPASRAAAGRPRPMPSWPSASSSRSGRPWMPARGWS